MTSCLLERWQLNLFKDHRYLKSIFWQRKISPACSTSSRKTSGMLSLAVCIKIQIGYVGSSFLARTSYCSSSVCSCYIQRPSSAQLVNHQFVKKMKKSSTLKDYKLLFNRCKRFKRSLARRKRNLARRESGYTG